ncbi:MAG: phosphate ABC transporter permease, partial [Bacteroidota bacterium]|nr:phosphate ABC transporter permease [Bacteroidota bacterium]
MRKIRKIEEAVFKTITRLAAYSLVVILGYILFIIFKNGLSSLSWEMISQVPSGGYYYGGDGGVLNAIIGSLYIALGATIIAIIIGVPAALFINSHLMRSRRKQNVIRYILDALWGIPSIVYGAFGFTLMVFLGLSASLLAGILTVSFLITPIVIRTF